MSRTTVDVYEYTHTCPGDRTPHVVDTRRTVVERTESEPCLAPVEVCYGGERVSVRCGRVRSIISQCDACRPVVVVRNRTRLSLGPAAGCHTPAPVGLADDPCRICGNPLAAALAATGRHILCGWGWTR